MANARKVQVIEARAVRIYILCSAVNLQGREKLIKLAGVSFV